MVPEKKPLDNDSKTPHLYEDSRGREGGESLVSLKSAVPPEVVELRDLLKTTGVMLHKREGGQDLGIKTPADYDFGKHHARLDELVFIDPVVFKHILRLPDGLIGPKNLIR